jgi:hypothetical protein
VKQNLPVSLVSNSRDWPAPRGSLSWWALMSYLARVEPAGEERFEECLRQIPPGTMAAAILAAPDPGLLAPLTDLRRAGSPVLAVMMDPAEWGAGEAGHAAGVEARRLAAELEAAGVGVRLVGAEPDWERAFAA